MDRNNEHRKRRNGRPDRPSILNYSNSEKYPPIPKIPRRDYAPDPITGEPIDNIFTAISHREHNVPVCFDTILNQLRNSEQIDAQHKLIYVGAGAFGVYEEIVENGRPRLSLVRKIPYEDNHEKPEWRRELAPGISRDYVPHPEPLSQLYTQEDLQGFAKVGAGSAIYLPRSS